jgi:hypothetical protein
LARTRGFVYACGVIAVVFLACGCCAYTCGTVGSFSGKTSFCICLRRAFVRYTYLFSLTPPRGTVTFFAAPKKVTKERRQGLNGLTWSAVFLPKVEQHLSVGVRCSSARGASLAALSHHSRLWSGIIHPARTTCSTPFSPRRRRSPPRSNAFGRSPVERTFRMN